MKINKFIAMAAIALMAIGAMGFITTRTHAQNGTTPAPQVQVTEVPDTETVSSVDTDTVEEQVGDQNAQDTTEDAAGESAEGESSDGSDPVPAGTPAITADAAVQAAQAFMNSSAAGTATLDDENGVLVYSVDLSGSDVKVDAMSGVVLGMDQVGDGQFDGEN
jgi:uncharacterized membrane protein YkoI